MDNTFWHKQTNEPLFPDLVWSRPQNKQTAGKLLIIGGNIHGFAAVGQAYIAAQQAGIGQIRIILPDVLQKTVSKLMPEADYAQSSPSGGFSQQALSEVLDQASWADGVLVAGDLGRNSETAILLEKLTDKYEGQLTFTKDAADYALNSASDILNRSNSLLVITMAQMQSLAKSVHFAKAFTFDMDLLNLVETLHEFTAKHSLGVVLKHLDTLLVAVGGQVSTTKSELNNDEAWRVPIAATAAVWWLQNPNKQFESITTALLNIKA